MTIEKFENEFNDAQSLELKRELIEKLLDSDIDFNDSEIKSKLKEYSSQLQDFKETMEIENSLLIDTDIENGKYQLYTCIEETEFFTKYVKGRNYYVSIDDISKRYIENIGDITDLNDEFKEYLSNINPVVWIVSDDGIGTLKRKYTFSDDFSKHFTIFG